MVIESFQSGLGLRWGFALRSLRLCVTPAVYQFCASLEQPCHAKAQRSPRAAAIKDSSMRSLKKTVGMLSGPIAIGLSVASPIAIGPDRLIQHGGEEDDCYLLSFDYFPDHRVRAIT